MDKNRRFSFRFVRQRVSFFLLHYSHIPTRRKSYTPDCVHMRDETLRRRHDDAQSTFIGIFMAPGRTGRIFIDPLCLPRRRCRVRVSISSTEIVIFIHKPRLERAHRAHNKARGLLDRLTLFSLLKAISLLSGT